LQPPLNPVNAYDELIVMKAELQRKVAELENATSDISNLLASTNIATLFLDND